MDSSRPALHWGHPQLQKIFEELPASGALLLVASNRFASDQLWDICRKSVIPSVDRAGLVPLLVNWSDKTANEWLNQINEKSIDLAIVNLRGTPPEWDAELIESLERWPCTLIVLMDRLPACWTKLFDLCLQFNKDVVTALTPEASNFRHWPLELKTSDSVTDALKISRPTVALRGFSSIRIDALTKSFPDIEWGDDGRPFASADIAVIVGEGAEDQWREQITEASASCLTIVSFGTSYREDDRITAYESGASYVLPPKFTNRELGTMLRTHVKHKHSVHRSEADDALAKELKQFRRGKSWPDGEEENLVKAYGNLMNLQHQKAVSEGRIAGLIVIKIPKIPEELEGTKWGGLLGNIYVDHISANLRKNDVSFIYHQSIVILSHNVSQLGALAIHRRLQLVADEITVPIPDIQEMKPSETAEEFLLNTLRRI